MAVNISGLRRNIKNVAHNYTDAQVKVREATSNDPWGPSSTMMSEIADLTYNVVAFSEIMQMVWKRLNDNGKNWRHVYKALVLLEYLIKTGSEKVAQQCKENIFAIQTLKDFQYLDDNKDQGINVREKAKALVALLKDDERLRNERVRALKAKERFAQNTAGIGSDTVYTRSRERYSMTSPAAAGPVHAPPHSSSDFEVTNPEIEAARPQTAGEEELQLQLALAMSREEAEQEESKSKSDDMRLQLALQKSQQEEAEAERRKKPSTDLLDLDFGLPPQEPAPGALPVARVSPSSAPFQPPPPVRTEASLDPWGMPTGNNATGVSPPPPAKNDPWTASGPTPSVVPVKNDPWSPVGQQQQPPQQQPEPPPPPPPPQQQQPQPQPQPPPQPPQPPQVSPIPTGALSGTSHSPRPTGLADNDPWTSVSSNGGQQQPPTASLNLDLENPDDLFSPRAQHQLAEFDLLRSEIEDATGSDTNVSKEGKTSPNPFDLNDLKSGLMQPSSESTGAKPKKTVKSMLGEHSNLVNLDNLVSTSHTQARNPFEHQQQNPFQAKVQKPPMNALMQQNAPGWNGGGQQQQSDINPFF